MEQLPSTERVYQTVLSAQCYSRRIPYLNFLNFQELRNVQRKLQNCLRLRNFPQHCLAPRNLLQDYWSKWQYIGRQWWDLTEEYCCLYQSAALNFGVQFVNAD